MTELEKTEIIIGDLILEVIEDPYLPRNIEGQCEITRVRLAYRPDASDKEKVIMHEIIEAFNLTHLKGSLSHPTITMLAESLVCSFRQLGWVKNRNEIGPNNK